MTAVRFQKAKEVLQGLTSAQHTSAPTKFAAATLNMDRLKFNVAMIDKHLEGGLARNALHEVRAQYAKDIGAAIGFILALLHRLPKNKHIIWVLDPATTLESGTLYPRGLAQHGIDPSRLNIIRARDLKTAMWAADEAVGCYGLGAIILHLKGNPAKFNMTASRRLNLRAQASNVFTCILRQSGEEEASAALTRWRIHAMPSVSHEEYKTGIGNVRLSLSLERNRNGQIGTWAADWDPINQCFLNAKSIEPAQKKDTTHIINRIPKLADRSDRSSKMGQVVDFGRATSNAAHRGHRHD